MKKVCILALAAICFTACNQANTKTNESTDSPSTNVPAVLAEDAPKMIFDKETFEFGAIVQGEKVQHDFKFKNTGKTPLIISNATATCGCTVPEYPTLPLKPGEEGVIKVVFNSQGKMGMQDKVVTITSNANPKAHQLHLIGEVKEK